MKVFRTVLWFVLSLALFYGCDGGGSSNNITDGDQVADGDDDGAICSSDSCNSDNHEICDPISGQCVCDEEWMFAPDGETCIPSTCAEDEVPLAEGCKPLLEITGDIWPLVEPSTGIVPFKAQASYFGQIPDGIELVWTIAGSNYTDPLVEINVEEAGPFPVELELKHPNGGVVKRVAWAVGMEELELARQTVDESGATLTFAENSLFSSGGSFTVQPNAFSDPLEITIFERDTAIRSIPSDKRLLTLLRFEPSGVQFEPNSLFSIPASNISGWSCDQNNSTLKAISFKDGAEAPEEFDLHLDCTNDLISVDVEHFTLFGLIDDPICKHITDSTYSKVCSLSVEGNKLVGTVEDSIDVYHLWSMLHTLSDDQLNIVFSLPLSLISPGSHSSTKLGDYLFMNRLLEGTWEIMNNDSIPYEKRFLRALDALNAASQHESKAKFGMKLGLRLVEILFARTPVAKGLYKLMEPYADVTMALLSTINNITLYQQFQWYKQCREGDSLSWNGDTLGQYGSLDFSRCTICSLDQGSGWLAGRPHPPTVPSYSIIGYFRVFEQIYQLEKMTSSEWSSIRAQNSSLIQVASGIVPTEPICGNYRIDQGEVCDSDTKPCSVLKGPGWTGNATCWGNCEQYSLSSCKPECIGSCEAVECGRKDNCGNVCWGEGVCNDPPEPVCFSNGVQSRIWHSPGSCSATLCNYRTEVIDCPQGCNEDTGLCYGDIVDGDDDPVDGDEPVDGDQPEDALPTGSFTYPTEGTVVNGPFRVSISANDDSLITKATVIIAKDSVERYRESVEPNSPSVGWSTELIDTTGWADGDYYMALWVKDDTHDPIEVDFVNFSWSSVVADGDIDTDTDGDWDSEECIPNCANKDCGPDGCGGSCLPGCSGGLVCDLETFDCVEVSSGNWSFPDTGQVECYDNSAVMTTCPSEGEDFFGQDSQHGENYMSFTSSGSGVVTHEDTGLMWQQGENSATGWASAVSYCDGLSLGGYSDWRLPSRKELMMIVDYGTYEPAIDDSRFPGTHSDYYWASEEYAGDDTKAWVVDFTEGAASYVAKTSGYFVRCVRGDRTCTPSCQGRACGPDGCGGDCGYCSDGLTCGPYNWCVSGERGRWGWVDTGQYMCFDNSAQILCPYEDTDFFGQDAQYHGVPMNYAIQQDVVHDNATGLTWQRRVGSDSADQTSAEAYCASLSLGGSSQWRLPSRMELITIIDYSWYMPAINDYAFPGTGSRNFWTSTLYAGDETKYWYVDFSEGAVSYAAATSGYAVRCVKDDFFSCLPECSGMDCGPDGCGGDCGYCSEGDTCTTDFDCVEGEYGHWPWPDTGQYTCYDNSEQMLCPFEGDDFFGQDAQYHGIDMNLTVDEHSVYDIATGLTWQRFVNDDLKTREEAEQYCNGMILGGLRMRLPTRHELITIVDYGRYQPAIDDYAFPDTGMRQFWTSTDYAGDETKAWYVEFNEGSVSYAAMTTEMSVRCVRGAMECIPDCTGKNCGNDGCGGECGYCSPPRICQDYQCHLTSSDGWPLPDTGQHACYDNSAEIDCPSSGEEFYGQDGQVQGNEPSYSPTANGTVVDNVTGVIWQRFWEESHSWEDAAQYCADLSLGGSTAWRLPSRMELAGIVDYSLYQSAIDDGAFPETRGGNFWTGTEYAGDSEKAWYVEFVEGAVSYAAKTSVYKVRCVR